MLSEYRACESSLAKIHFTAERYNEMLYRLSENPFQKSQIDKIYDVTPYQLSFV